MIGRSEEEIEKNAAKMLKDMLYMADFFSKVRLPHTITDQIKARRKKLLTKKKKKE